MGSIPFAIALSFLGSFLFQSFLPLFFKEILYTLGLCAKNIISFFLPCVVFGMIFRSSSTIAHNATRLLLRMIIGVALSTFVCIFMGSGIGWGLYHKMDPLHFPSCAHSLTPLFSVPSLVFLKNEWALLGGLLWGIFLGKRSPDRAKKISVYTQWMVDFSLKIIGCAIPLFVCGFIIKMGHEGVFSVLLEKYTLVFSSIFVSTMVFLFCVYLSLAQWSLSQGITLIRNILPAALSGLTTLSSAASLPLLVKGVEKNTGNKDLSDFASPIAVNVHMVGECFANMILAYAILKTYNVTPPTPYRFCIFSVFFFLARFSCAGIPGGGIWITMPLFKKYFCFNSEMTSLMATVTLLLDPLITGINLLGDGALCQWMARTYPQKTTGSFRTKDHKDFQQKT